MPAADAVYPLPDADLSLAHRVFPGLGVATGAGRHATFVGSPRLHPTAEEPAPWSPEAVVAMLKGVPVGDVFGHPSRLRYLTDFLELARDACSHPSVTDALIDMGHSAFAQIGARGLVAVGDPFAQFLDMIPTGRRVVLVVGGLDEANVEGLLRGVAQGGRLPRVMLVPTGGKFGAWASPAPSPGRLSPDDAGIILPHLAGPLGEAIPPASRSSLATSLIAAMGPAARRLGEPCDAFPLFLGRRPPEPSARLLCGRELTEAHRRGRLFAGGDPGLAAMLQAALHDGGIVVDQSGVARHLCEGDVRPCDSSSCLRVLDGAPDLTEAERPRLALLGKLVGLVPADAIGRYRRPLRYLLHGLRDHYGSDETLFAGLAPNLSRIWQILARRVLASGGGVWRAVADVMPGSLSREQQHALDLHPLDLDRTIGLLRGAGPGRIDLDDLTDDDRDAIVRECQADHFDVVRALPIHRAVRSRRDGGNRLVPIVESARWKGDYPVPDDLPDDVILLEPAASEALRAKQKELHPPVLDAEGVLRLILERPDPSSRWGTIVGALNAHKGEISDDLRPLLRGSRWLPVRRGEPAAPSEIIFINLSHDQDLIRRVLDDARPGPHAPRGVALLTLAGGLDDPERFLDLLKRFEGRPDVREGDLKRLGDILAADDRYRIGPFDPDDFDPASFLRVFAGAAKEVMRCAEVVGHLCEEKKRAGPREGQINRFRRNVLPQLLGALTPVRLVGVLNVLADREEVDPSARSETRSWFARYLCAAVKEPSFRDAILPQIRLLDRTGRWRPPGDLCLEAEGVGDHHLLDRKHAEVLKPAFPSPEGEDIAADSSPVPGGVTGSKPTGAAFDRSVQRLLDEAKVWESTGIAPGAIGGVLALLGDHEEIVKAAADYLGDRPREAVLVKLGWRPLRTVGGKSLDEGDVVKRMEGQRFIVDFNATKTVSALNLLGDRVSRPMREDFEHLWLDWGWYGGRAHRIELRATPADKPPAKSDMERLLKETARRLLDKVYHQPEARIKELWGELASGDQLDVAYAQDCILNDACVLLRALGVRRTGPLDRPLRAWEKARRLKVEIDRDGSRSGGWAETSKRAEELKSRAIQELRDLLEGDPEGEAIGDVLKATRDKLLQFEYEPASVPFELFQNADDAAVELVRHRPDASPDLARRFVLAADAGELRVAHEGRPINRWYLGGFNGRDMGYGDDLVKMLQLNWSDKAHDVQVTGRFGLGFKSVFLVSDSPRALSGRIAFEVAGGLYPKEIGEDVRRELEGKLALLLPNVRPGDGTLYAIPLCKGVATADVVDRFAKVAHLLVVFGRRLRECIVQRPGVAAAKAEWRERALPNVPGAHLGRLRPVTEEGGQEMLALVLRAGEDDPGAFLLGLDEAGFVALSPPVPSIWATAPTRDEEGFGVALNADFTLNAGRARLAEDLSRNCPVAESLGRRLGERLVAFFVAAEASWPEMRGEMGFKPDAIPGDLWRSLWEVTGRGLAGSDSGSPAGKLLRYTLWGGGDRGMARLIAEHAALPTGLPGVHDVLTRLDRVEHATTGLLAAPNVFEAVSCWPRFAASHHPGKIVAGRIADDVNKLMDLTIRRLSLEQVVLTELSHETGLAAEPVTANRLGRLITTHFLRTSRKDAERDHDALEELLPRVKFRASDGGWQPAGTLLIMDGEGEHSDEAARAAFAPAGSVLHRDYDLAGRSFVRACRPAQRMMADLGRLATWAMQADESRRRAVVDYLVDLGGNFALSGLLVNRLRQELATKTVGWFRDLAIDSPYFAHLDAETKGILLVDLGLGQRPSQGMAYIEPRPTRSPRAILADLYDRAEEQHDEIIEWYEQATYPEGVRPVWSHDGPGEDVESRRGWLTLFLLGAAHRMGRTRRGQDRGFLRFCSEQGYLDTFARPEHDFAAWMGVLYDYLDRQVQDAEYFHWMGQFVSIFQLSRWLRQYAQQFQSFEQWDEGGASAFRLHAQLSPKVAISGIYAPPVAHVFGIGACFVVRELTRGGLFQRGKYLLRPYCYPPYRQVRRLLRDLGCPGLDDVVAKVDRLEQSTEIHRFLCEHLGKGRADFGGLYDLPLLWLAEDRDLRYDILSTTPRKKGNSLLSWDHRRLIFKFRPMRRRSWRISPSVASSL